MPRVDPLHLAVAIVFGRFDQLAHPVGGQESPVQSPQSLSYWLEQSGVYSSTLQKGTESAHDVVQLLYPNGYNTRLHDPEDLAIRAMQRMCLQCRAERVQSGLYRRVLL